MYDVIIVGGSFAGLATAMQLRDYQVLLIDQQPIGAHQTSACGTPLATAQAVGAESAVQEVHDALVLHTAGQEIRFPLRDPFVTFDYRAFCQAMLHQTEAEVWLARASGIADGEVTTNRGSACARFVVDATGWHALHSKGLQPARPLRHAGYGLETELPVRLDLTPGLHFYSDKRLIRNGYAWVFPCGSSTRFGVGSFDGGLRLRALLARFLDQFGLQPAATHGGVLAIERRDPVVGDVFVAGDAAGQCLPVTGEGIRTAIFHGVHCGRAIATALSGTLSTDEARILYREQVRSLDRFHSRLLKLQTVVAHTPELPLALAGQIVSRSGLTRNVMDSYLAKSGWFMGA